MEPVELFRQCNGCNDCELACSFRATGTFWRPASAIRVRKQPAGMTAKFRIEVDGEDCDLCAGEEIPQCQVVCRSGALHLESLRLLRLQPASSSYH
jgi:ferredoxin